MSRVYIAGPYSCKSLDGNVIEILSNMRRGLAISIQVMQAGHAAFIPWLDFQLGLIADISMDMFKRNSMEWVKVSDAMLLVEGWEDSAGCRAEVAEASLQGVPVFDAEFEFDKMIDFLNDSANHDVTG